MVKVASRRQGEDWICDIEVEHAGEKTNHTVSVTKSDLERWGGDGDVDALVERSFEFLLRRERPSSILQHFDLSVIQRYFPEYDQEIRARS